MDLDQAHHFLKTEGTKCILEHGLCRFGRQPLPPTVTCEIVSQFNNRVPIKFHVLKSTVTDQPVFRFQDHGKQAVTVSVLMRQIPLYPGLHLFTAER